MLLALDFQGYGEPQQHEPLEHQFDEDDGLEDHDGRGQQERPARVGARRSVAVEDECAHDAGDEQEPRPKTPPRLYKMKLQKRRKLWQFVVLSAKREHWNLADNELKNDHAEFAFCKRCKCSIPFKVGQHKVLDHMETYHRRELLGYMEEQKQLAYFQRTGKSMPLKHRLDGDFDEAAPEARGRPIRSITPEQQQHVNRLLAKWIARHFRAMLMVEDAGFVEFVRYITVELGRVQVALPKRTQLRKDIIAYAAGIREQVKQAIGRGCKFFSITSDIWTARNTRSYISCTLHYVDDNFVSKNWTLEVQELRV